MLQLVKFTPLVIINISVCSVSFDLQFLLFIKNIIRNLENVHKESLLDRAVLLKQVIKLGVNPET